MKISGKGYEEFSKAYEQGCFRYSQTQVLHIGKAQYRFKNNQAARINPSTGKRVGPIRRLEVALRGKEWTVEIE